MAKVKPEAPRSASIPPRRPGDVETPTAYGLVLMGLAQEVEVSTGKKSTAKVYRISEEGQKLIYDAMRYNARAAIARGEGEWTQPPSSGQLRLDTPVDASTSAQNEVGEAGVPTEPHEAQGCAILGQSDVVQVHEVDDVHVDYIDGVDEVGISGL